MMCRSTRSQTADLRAIRRSLVGQWLVGLALVMGCLMAPLRAETVLLDAAVGTGPLVVEMHRAEVQIFIDPAGENFIQVIDPQPQPTVDGSVVQSSRQDGALLVQRSEVEGEAAGPVDLRVDIVLTPGTPVTLRGFGLSVIVEDTAFVRRLQHNDSQENNEGEVEADEPASIIRAPNTAQKASTTTQRDIIVRLDVKQSEVEAWGLADLAVVVDGCDVRLEGTRDHLLLESKDSQIGILRHRGALQARGEDGELTVEDGRGSFDLDWQGGELRFQGGEGKLAAHLEGATLDFDAWRGDLAIEGDDAIVRGEDGRSSGRGLDVRGKNLDVYMGSWRGNLNVRLDRGRLGGGPWRGKLSVTAREGASVDLEPLFGELKLWLRSDASARLQGITGTMQADLENSELDLEGTTRNLEFLAKGSTANLQGVEHLRKFRASDSTVSVDLAYLKSSRPTFEALDGSRVRIDALAPCLVDINSSTSLDSLDLDISGCETKQLGVGRRGGRAPTRIDGAPMTRIVVRLSEDSSMEVEGR